MKVLMVNGSPNEAGCTFTALKEIAGELKKEGIESEIVQIGKKPVQGCIACRKCQKEGLGKCVFDDVANVILEKATDADALIVGSPVYFAGANGSLTSVLDRAFYSGRKALEYKPAAAIVSARRAGTTAALDRLNKYFSLSCMPIVSSKYWLMVHGNNPDEVKQDLEGLQVLRLLARNMAWLLKCIEAGKSAQIKFPHLDEKPERTNFIR